MKLDRALTFGAIFLVALVGLAAGIVISGLIAGVDTESGARLIRLGAPLVIAFTALLAVDALAIARRRRAARSK